jgi:hypothetical protein
MPREEDWSRLFIPGGINFGPKENIAAISGKGSFPGTIRLTMAMRAHLLSMHFRQMVMVCIP